MTDSQEVNGRFTPDNFKPELSSQTDIQLTKVPDELCNLLAPNHVARQTHLDRGESDRLVKMLRSADVLFFDLDDTLVLSKRRVSKEIASMLSKMLQEDQKIVITTGGKFEVIMRNLINQLPEGSQLQNLILFPLFGLEQYEFDLTDSEYKLKRTIQEHEFPEEKLDGIGACIAEALLEDEDFLSGYKDVYGRNPSLNDIHEKILERRGKKGVLNYSVSLLGQVIPQEFKIYKANFDLNRAKRERIILLIKAKLVKSFGDEAEKIVLSTGGSTSIDITWGEATKLTGIRDYRKNNPDSSRNVFFGDSLQEGGNDHSVTGLLEGIFWVGSPEETLTILKKTFS